MTREERREIAITKATLASLTRYVSEFEQALTNGRPMLIATINVSTAMGGLSAAVRRMTGYSDD